MQQQQQQHTTGNEGKEETLPLFSQTEHDMEI